MWSSDANVSFLVKANESDATLAGIRAAANREQLNDLYVKNGTLIILEGGSDEGKVKVACKVSQIGGASAPLKVHFAADPGKKSRQDTVVSANDLAGTGDGSLKEGSSTFCLDSRAACSQREMTAGRTSSTRSQLKGVKAQCRSC